MLLDEESRVSQVELPSKEMRKNSACKTRDKAPTRTHNQMSAKIIILKTTLELGKPICLLHAQ